MNDNSKVDTPINTKSTNRTCAVFSEYNGKYLYTPYITKAPLQQLDLNFTHTHTPNTITATLQPHSLSDMPPYRYGGGCDSTTSSLSLLPLSRRRWFQRQTCLLCIMAAFIFGLFLGIFVPMVDLRNVFTNMSTAAPTNALRSSPATTLHHVPNGLAEIALEPLPYDDSLQLDVLNRTSSTVSNGHEDTPLSAFSVAFINEHHGRIGAEEILSDSVNMHEEHSAMDRREVRMQRMVGEPLARTAEQRAAKMLQPVPEPAFLKQSSNENTSTKNILQRPNVHKTQQISSPHAPGIIKSNIYWGELVERALPQGFSAQDTRDWNAYVASQTVVQHLELGCGRMQNRLLIFRDGTRACARYRQNTDQIQGELFSFYLGRLLNMTNLAPSAVLTVNVESDKWSAVVRDITQAQWKQQRPVVLTRWLPYLEPAGIPQPFQPIDRHLNKHDVWNITLALTASDATVQTPLVAYAHNDAVSSVDIPITPTSLALEHLVELAQWSDLIVFDYLIANLDRVVNNLYNYQWNAEIMAAPAHNLARQSKSQLLLFLDNESGLLHGYRLLKKYEAYHGLLLNNLCVFREPTIRALRQLREAGAGRKLREIFERTASDEVRDVLPTLPDKSVKILNDRIDRVLQQVDKCKQLMSDS
ncbi:extracellular serine/threonine protein kinase four-jointed [Ceratitis capitata]|uniref:(Mediterranean fruit fly) hypothetical protein n=1 Tax=Ceratitis capitata TaxID=7213 RepID=A0A811VDG4_CERCA|nr:extracellular serine/threonine protein kinase four-jointed [Ceratitis capitata]CAD7014368.1 unnamed protein product [Ceratitis capitata]